MTTFNNGESGSSVRTKINAAISTVDGLGSGDNLLMTAAERSKLAGIAASAIAALLSDTSPQLGGILDANSFGFGFTGSNTTGSTITKGTPVYLSGTGLAITPADADGSGTMPCIGIASEDIANSASGLVVTLGEVAGIDTSSYSVNDPLYISTTAGALTGTAPTSGTVQEVARVVSSHASTGEIWVNTRSGGLPIGSLGASEAVTTSDLAVFGNASDSNNAAARTFANVISDLALLTATNTATVSGKAITHGYNPQSETTYTLVLTDQSKIITMSNASANTLTIPPNSSVAFPIGTVITIWMLGAGTTTIAGGTGVTLSGNGGSGSAYSADIQTQYNSATIMKIAIDQWVITGDIDAVAA